MIAIGEVAPSFEECFNLSNVLLLYYCNPL